MERQIRFCTTTMVCAWLISIMGQGPALVVATSVGEPSRVDLANNRNIAVFGKAGESSHIGVL